MSLVLGVEILGEYKNLTAATKGAEKQLSGFNDKVTKASKAMKSALGSIGIGLSFNAAINAFEDLTKAAIEDRKSQELLALAMKNTGKATADQVVQAEKAINKMQFSAAVADDVLRPSYQKLFIATKDVTRSNELLQIALDASAATGKSLDVVSQAMAKSLAGSDTALTKLIPSLKGSKDPINDMAKAYEGASEAAANQDPYKKMETILGDIQDRIGTGLMPAIDKLSGWMSSEDGIGTLNSATLEVEMFLKKINLVIDGATILKDRMGKLFSTITEGLKVDGLNTWLEKTIENVKNALNPLGRMLDLLAGIAIQMGAGQPSYSLPNVSSETLDKVAANSGITIKKPAAKTTTVTQNIKITGQQSAQQIATKLNSAAKYSGTQLLRGGR